MNAEDRALLLRAWKRLIIAWLAAFAASLAVGFCLIYGFRIAPEKLLALSTQRLAVAGAVIAKGLQLGIDSGLLLFVWNISGALATLSFIYTASLINPSNVDRFPRMLRKALCGQKPMKALCYLPGCAKMTDEPLRRLHVWLMVPLLGTLLLGLECGLIVSAVTRISGSFVVGVVSLLPHGIIEIPAFALAGAIPFSAHLFVKHTAGNQAAEAVFDQVDAFRRRLPVRRVVWLVIISLLIAGLIEGHITPFFLDYLKK
ncbi:MAG: stage II sporulation protein M [Desulfosalsimonadaceae bacterium]